MALLICHYTVLLLVAITARPASGAGPVPAPSVAAPRVRKWSTLTCQELRHDDDCVEMARMLGIVLAMTILGW